MMRSFQNHHLKCTMASLNEIKQSSLSTSAERFKRPWSEMPQPPKYPIIGNGYLFLKKKNMVAMHMMHKELREQFGDIYKTEAFGDTLVHIHNPRDSETLLKNDGTRPIVPGFHQLAEFRRIELPKFFSQTTGLVSQGEEWSTFRQMVQQDMMKQESALYYIEELEQIAKELTDILAAEKDTKGKINIGVHMKKYALEATGAIFLGSHLGVMKGSKTGETMIEQLDVFTMNSLPLFVFPLAVSKWMPFYKDIIKALEIVLNISTDKINDARGKVNDTSNQSVLMKLMRRCGKVSDVPVVMALDALAGGIDTTGNSCIFLLYHLATNPEKQEKLYKEICKTIGKDGNLSANSLSKMKYLKACQRESQRMTPVAGGTSRQTQVDMELGGYEIPVGTKVIRWGIIASNSAENFDNPDLFTPERWLRGDTQYKKTSPYANLPFGHGPRSCIGQRFAKLEIYMVMAKVVQRFKLEYKGEDVGLKTGLINSPDRDVMLILKQR